VAVEPDRELAAILPEGDVLRAGLDQTSLLDEQRAHLEVDGLVGILDEVDRAPVEDVDEVLDVGSFARLVDAVALGHAGRQLVAGSEARAAGRDVAGLSAAPLRSNEAREERRRQYQNWQEEIPSNR